VGKLEKNLPSPFKHEDRVSGLGSSWAQIVGGHRAISMCLFYACTLP